MKYVLNLYMYFCVFYIKVSHELFYLWGNILTDVHLCVLSLFKGGYMICAYIIYMLIKLCYINGLVQYCSNFIANTLELLQSWTKPLKTVLSSFLHFSTKGTYSGISLVVHVVVILFPAEYKQWRTEYMSNITTTINIDDYYLNQCCNIVDWILGNKLKWNFNQNTTIFIYEDAFEKWRPFCLGLNVLFTHVFRGCFTGIGAIIWIPQCLWSNPAGYGWNLLIHNHRKTQHSKTQTVWISLGMYCMMFM